MMERVPRKGERVRLLHLDGHPVGEVTGKADRADVEDGPIEAGTHVPVRILDDGYAPFPVLQPLDRLIADKDYRPAADA